MKGAVLLNLLSIFLINSSLKQSVSSTTQTLPNLSILSPIVVWLQAFPLSIFYRYFHGNCFLGIRNIISDPVMLVRSTRSSTQSHDFQVTPLNPQALFYKSCFIPRTSQQWNTLQSTAFPESYNLSSFKSNINKLDLISL